MIANGFLPSNRQKLRRDLLRQYVRLQRRLMEADPTSSSYQATIHAFRQLGHTLISSGFEDDLDRLLRIRVLDGGRAEHTRSREQSAQVPEMYVLERRAVTIEAQ